MANANKISTQNIDFSASTNWSATRFLRGDGTWQPDGGGTIQGTIPATAGLVLFASGAADTVDTNTGFVFDDTSGNLIIGGSLPAAARLHLISTTEQLRVGYDASNYYSTTVSSTGLVTFNAVGAGSKFLFSDAVQGGVTGTPSFTSTFGSYNSTFQFDFFAEDTSTSGVAALALQAGTAIFQAYKLGNAIGGVFQTSTVSNNSLSQFVSGNYNENFSLHGSNIYFFTGLGAGTFAASIGSSGAFFGVIENMGTAPSAKMHIMGTSKQLQIAYDASNYYSATVSSTGHVTFDAVGSSAQFTFSDNVNFSQAAIMGTVLRLRGFTVAGLPAGTTGNTAYVTDALAPTYNTALTGGGAIVVPVFYNGAAWVSA